MATVGALAALVSGRVVGNPDRQLSGVADLDSAGPDQLSFLANPKYARSFACTRAGAVLVTEAIAQGAAGAGSLIVCDDPYLALARIARELHPPTSWPAGVENGAHVHPTAKVDPTATIRVAAVIEDGARIGPRALIGPSCYVGREAEVGADVVMHPGARLLERCRLGDRVILQAGAVIGSDGFGYAPDGGRQRHKIPQVGIVELGDDVEIGANTTIDRATFGVTRIGAGTKIDNLVQIAHNVSVGRDCVIVSQSGIAGSTVVGDRVIMGARTGLVGHLHIADDVVLAARTGVAHDLRQAGIYSGTPSVPHRLWRRMVAAQKSLPELVKRVRELEQRLAALLSERG